MIYETAIEHLNLLCAFKNQNIEYICYNLFIFQLVFIKVFI
jgi:hypothetical protein